MKKNKNKFWKRLKTFFKWTLIMIILFLILQFLENFYHDYLLLIDKVNEQGQYIDHMNQQVNLLKESNNLLSDQVHDLTVKINGQEIKPTISTPKHHFELPKISVLPVVPITTTGMLMMMKIILSKVSLLGT
jgi:cell division protein FtsB